MSDTKDSKGAPVKLTAAQREFDVHTFELHIDVDGLAWFEAHTTDGHTIGGMRHFSGKYEIQVSGPTDNRHYTGGEGSDAHLTYDRFVASMPEAGRAALAASKGDK